MTLHHEVRGDGEHTILLLHGFLGSGRNLMSLARSWSERDKSKRFVLVDLPGHGESPALSDGDGLDQAGEQVAALAKELSSEPVDIVGHSLGGRVAICAAAQSKQIDAVTLLDIAPGPITTASGPAAVIEALQQAPAEASSRGEMKEQLAHLGIDKALLDWLLMNLTRDGDRYRWRIDREALARFHERTRGADLWGPIDRGEVKVEACIRGGDSPFVSDEEAKRLEDAGARVVTLPGIGHFVHAQALERTVEALVQSAHQTA